MDAPAGPGPLRGTDGDIDAAGDHEDHADARIHAHAVRDVHHEHDHDDDAHGRQASRHDQGTGPGSGHGHGHGHGHDAANAYDDALTASRQGMRALVISLVGLLVTAGIQIAVVAFSRSVGLLADAIHNAGDALTALPIGIAFRVGRRSPTHRYTYGFGRAEDLAGLVVLVVIAGSAVIAAWESVARLAHPSRVTDLGYVAAAGAVGFLGNEVAAAYRVRIGRRIGSAALVADGMHARADGLTSLGVVVGAGAVSLGWRTADPLVGLVITVSILWVLRTAARDVYRRLMDGVDPAVVALARETAAATDGVEGVNDLRVRWTGHRLRAELAVTVDRDFTIARGHDIAEDVRRRLVAAVPRLEDAQVHVDPCSHDGSDPHASAGGATDPSV